VTRWIKIAQFDPLGSSFAIPSKALHTLDISLLLSDESSSDSGPSLSSDGGFGGGFGGCGAGGDLRGNEAGGGAGGNSGSGELGGSSGGLFAGGLGAAGVGVTGVVGAVGSTGGDVIGLVDDADAMGEVGAKGSTDLFSCSTS